MTLTPEQIAFVENGRREVAYTKGTLTESFARRDRDNAEWLATLTTDERGKYLLEEREVNAAIDDTNAASVSGSATDLARCAENLVALLRKHFDGPTPPNP